jgi:hypothetical protein
MGILYSGLKNPSSSPFNWMDNAALLITKYVINYKIKLFLI